MPVFADDLPVRTILPQLRQALATHHRALLQAPPGAGKTTLVPLDLLTADWLGDQKILLLEPRRLAARSVARRMAELLGEKVGETVGWRMQLDTRVSARTRIEVVTEGVLTRMLQSDPGLEGVGLVIFDEFHERSVHADLGMAFVLQCQEGYRDDDNPLKLLVMSATLATDELGRFLGCPQSFTRFKTGHPQFKSQSNLGHPSNNSGQPDLLAGLKPGCPDLSPDLSHDLSKSDYGCPILVSEGRGYGVVCFYRDRPLGKGDARELIGQCAATVRMALERHEGSVLVFLPGAVEIRQVAEQLMGSLPANVSVHALYGDLDKEAQDQAILPSPAGQRKVVLATAIAESSLTIEGVHIVVDAGLMRVPRFDARTGMASLDTVRVSKASAEQRAGRAGRLAPGHCYRLWTEVEHQQLVAYSEPEICATDLTPLALEILAWGVGDAQELDWLTPPPAPALARAFDLLAHLGAVSGEAGHYRITRHGQAMATLGLHPRLAHMVLLARQRGLEWLSVLLCVLLSERDPFVGTRHAGVDVHLRLGFLEGQDIPGITLARGQKQRYRQLLSQWQQRLNCKTRASYDNDDVALLLASAYPDRVAQRRSQDDRFLLSSGQGVAFRDAESLSSAEYLVIPVVGGHSHQREASVFLACEIYPETIRELFAEQIETRDEVRWSKRDKAVLANRVERFGALVLTQQSIKHLSPELVSRGLLAGIRDSGLQVLPWTSESEALRQRVCCLRTIHSRWPDFSESALLNALEQWLLPFIEGMSRLDDLKGVNLGQCLHGFLQSTMDWSYRQELEQEAPEHIQVPSGSWIAVDYSQPQEPILAVKLQELFGWQDVPKLAYGKIPLTVELLSPARRPVQKTRDLRNFWNNTYQDVKKELSGRYPKHPWPNDPQQAQPTARCKPRNH